MVASEICTVVLYISSMFILRSYFDITVRKQSKCSASRRLHLPERGGLGLSK